MTSHRMGECSACVLQDPFSSTDSVSVSVPQKLKGQCVSKCPTKAQKANMSVSVPQKLKGQYVSKCPTKAQRAMCQ